MILEALKRLAKGFREGTMFVLHWLSLNEDIEECPKDRLDVMVQSMGKFHLRRDHRSTDTEYLTQE